MKEIEIKDLNMFLISALEPIIYLDKNNIPRIGILGDTAVSEALVDSTVDLIDILKANGYKIMKQ